MESYNRRQKLKQEEKEAELKANIVLNSVLARQIGEYVACLFSEEVRITQVNELFPTLFKDEKEDKKKIEQDMALYKAKMEAFAFRHNSNFKRKGE
ncbi:TPA: hypothetical protein I9Z65_000559 [Clostridium perfringens]|nr:hypothetical protein [Clostridium perfringens]HBC2032372.1 hypothetical protein [Clostridium perfringens]HBC2056107.1 hypothetical protein [Clostridium perfringens]HBC2070227.1 hypothetical protein [Clostridium perfringens]